MSEYEVSVLIGEKISLFTVYARVVRIDGDWLVFYNDTEYRPSAIFCHERVLSVFIVGSAFTDGGEGRKDGREHRT